MGDCDETTTRSDWAVWVTGWAEWARAGGMARSTIGLYRWHLRSLTARHADPAAVTTDDLAHWLARDTWAPETRKSGRAAARSLYRWAVATGRIERDPTAELRPVKVPTRQAPAHPPRRDRPGHRHRAPTDPPHAAPRPVRRSAPR